MKLTIDHNSHGDIVARDESGKILATRKRNCNPAALRQIILDVEMLGAEIDWPNATGSPTGQEGRQ